MLEKTDLLDAIAPTNRGLLITPEQKTDILSKITQLEGRNPTPNPLAAAELLNGNWQLLYTTSDELLGIDRFPLLALGSIYQCVRIEQQRIYNLAEIKSVIGGLVSVTATFEAVSQQRVNVRFDRAIFGLQSTLGYQNPSQFIDAMQQQAQFNLLKGIDFTISSDRDPGWLEITYLDDTMRIGRGNQGSVFVLRKV
ncbi:PAP/fibrillin family protein [Leptolyngbya cf. ectocarpi LEGE 11479]|uniref:PAP/fibrillin family protein n=1 Tax=Leptolyngbya cf. ectocarpi LEGE 11479 TaxID=1828722 RepID=A0A928X1L1_LEPEC|nr:PAP/fibrillin family protein [Leptolyngbya ectocarpi]MBE9065884.1 PAP/fibrillin family protein [Leptolyngbya cf. ectocarpi LEGE 11479]